MICRSDGVAHVRRRVALVATVAVTPFSVERELDPPATRGDGALAIVSACQLPRRRGAPLLRPLARLTSFGGYVATGADDA